MVGKLLNLLYREFREKRLGIEIVKDTVELSLQTELEIIKHHQGVLGQILHEVGYSRVYMLVMSCFKGVVHSSQNFYFSNPYLQPDGINS